MSGGDGLAVDGSHTYSGPGEYTITVTAHDVHGASAVASGTDAVARPPPAKAGCLSSIPSVGATSGRYGKPLAPGPPNWGLSADDRVVRFGDLVVCAVDAPWTYEGAPLQTGGARARMGKPPASSRQPDGSSSTALSSSPPHNPPEPRTSSTPRAAASCPDRSRRCG